MDKSWFHRIFPSNSQDFTTPRISFEFSEFYYTSNSFLRKPINTNDRKTCPFREILSQRIGRGEDRVECGQINTKDRMQIINLIQSNATHCAKLGLMRVQKSYMDASSAQVTAQGLFGGFSFCGLKKQKGGDSWIHSTAQRKEHSKTEFGKKNSKTRFGELETFYQSKFIRATGVSGI